MGVYEKARRETKEKIVQEFWKLYKENTINKITVKNITDACGVHRATFYIHFKDIYEILDEIENNLLIQIQNIDVTDADNESGLNSIGWLVFKEYRKNREYLRVIVTEQRDSIFAGKYKKEMINLMLRIAQNPIQDESHKQRKIVEITARQCIETFLQCADDDCFSFEDTINVIKGFMMNGYYQTLKELFSIEGLRKPFEDCR